MHIAVRMQSPHDYSSTPTAQDKMQIADAAAIPVNASEESTGRTPHSYLRSGNLPRRKRSNTSPRFFIHLREVRQRTHSCRTLFLNTAAGIRPTGLTVCLGECCQDTAEKGARR
jgi:hypothetical protein